MLVAVIIPFLIFILIFLKFYYSNDVVDDNGELKISVIVAAKNEEYNLNKLIEKLINQNYSVENYEVIIVDDKSSDNTFVKGISLIENQANFSIITSENKKYNGKRGALQIGIDNAKYPHILITDADCEPSELWIKSFSNNFEQGFDFLFGIAPFKQTNALVNKIASFDNLWVHILTFSFANIGLPYSAAARSFGFRIESFNKIEGYKYTTDTLSGDDDLLLREAVKHNLKIGTVTNNSSFVYSTSKDNFKDYLNQKSRHTSTSNYYSLKIKIFLSIWHLLNLVMLFSPILGLYKISCIFLFLVKIIADLIIVKILMKSFSYKFGVLEIIGLQIVYEFMIVTNYIRGLFFKNKW